MQRGIDHRRLAGRIAGCVSLIIAAMNVLIDFRVQADELVAPATAVPQQLILIFGAAGAEEFVPQFSAWADRWREAAARGAVECVSIGDIMVGDANVGDAAAGAPPAEKSGDASNPTDRDRVLSELRRLVASGTSEPLWIVFIGHGTFDSRSAKLNLNGPDLSADELATALEPATRPVAAIFCASSTSPFINALSAPGRVVISATKDGNQIQFSRFGDAFSQAVAGLDADIDRDGQSSLLEAWLYASRRTAEFYKSEGRLATEHSLLDDNGDGKGSRAELFEGDEPAKNIESPAEVDGALARRIQFVRSPEEQALTADERVLRDALEARIHALQQRRAAIDEDSYFQQMEELLLPLSRLYETVEQRSPAAGSSGIKN